MNKKSKKLIKKSLENLSLNENKEAVFLKDSGKSLWGGKNEWDLEVLGSLLKEALEKNYQDNQKIIVSYEGIENGAYHIGLRKTKTLKELKEYYHWFLDGKPEYDSEVNRKI